ncbi:hypothetical protein BJD16_03605 [Aeromonas sobria]|uniref:Uncharacterized protein n=1 Tax=Aeromonas sobria TaxID=646 RepID=A0A1S2CST5_AERSO|nr:hypothetical protein BJD16_03605 [Aeromonas sobria]
MKTKNTDLSGCAVLDITTAEQWLTLPSDMQCSFSVYEPYEVNEAIRAQILYNDVSESKAKMWNEVVVDTSKWNKPISSYPIQAIFYHRGYLGSPVFERGGLEGAKYEQIRFFEESNKIIPIVAIDDKNIDYVFSYNEEDQAIHE